MINLDCSAADLRRNIVAMHRRHMREWALQWRIWRPLDLGFAAVFLHTAIKRRDWANEEAAHL
jgi:hypothetical protein